MTNRWVRLHRSALHNPKVVLLNDRLFRAWISCLLIADDAGKLPCLRDIACHLRMTISEAEQILCELIEAVLVDADFPGTPQRSFHMHDWAAHQYTSDSSSERTRKYRERLKENGGDGAVTSRAPSRAVAVTPPEAEANSETDTEILARGRRTNFLEGSGKRSRGVSPRLQERAEGLGLPVAEFVRRATEPGVKKPDALFRHLAVDDLQRQLPSASRRLLSTAL